MLEIFDKILANSPQWAIGISLIIIILSFIFFFWNRNLKKTIIKIIKYQDEINLIKYRLITREQMKYVEDYISDIFVLCSTNIRHFLIEKKDIQDDKVNENCSYKILKNLVQELLVIDAKPRLREEFFELREIFHIDTLKECTFDEIADKFNIHKTKTIETIIKISREFMSKNWISLKDITRKEGLSTMDFKIIEDSLNKIFDYAIMTQMKFYKRIKELEKEIK